jgi:hypothetical protein
MGIVWLAQRVDGEASMEAAIQLLPPALVGPLREDGGLLRRFLLEKLLDKLEPWQALPRMRPFLMELKASARAEWAELFGGANSNPGNRTRSREHRLAAVALWGNLARLDPWNVRHAIQKIENEFLSERQNLPSSGTPGGEKWAEYEQRWLKLERSGEHGFPLNRSIGNFYFWRAIAHGLEKASFEKAPEWLRGNLAGNERNPLVLRDLAIVHEYLASAE